MKYKKPEVLAETKREEKYPPWLTETQIEIKEHVAKRIAQLCGGDLPSGKPCNPPGPAGR